MLPEYYLFIYVVILGLVARLTTRRILEFVLRSHTYDIAKLKKLAGSIAGISVLFIIVSVVVWSFTNSYFLGGSPDSLMIGGSIFGGVGITVFLPSFTLHYFIKKEFDSDKTEMKSQ